MAYTAADASEKVTLLTIKPDDMAKPTVSELNGGIDIQDTILKSDFSLTATDSTTHPDTPLGSKGEWTNFASTKATASLTVLRDLDEHGQPDSGEGAETTFAALKERGTEVWLYVRKGPNPDGDWAADDEVRIGAQGQTDVPREPSDSQAGFIKVVVPFGVQDFVTYVAVVAGAE